MCWITATTRKQYEGFTNSWSEQKAFERIPNRLESVIVTISCFKRNSFLQVIFLNTCMHKYLYRLIQSARLNKTY